MEKLDLIEKTIGIVGNAKNRKLIENLEKQGNKIVLFPESEPALLKIESEFLSKVNDFDWLIFTDLYAVDFFLHLLEEKEFNLFELDALRICALGEAVADRLRFRQIHSDVIPADNRMQTIFSALEDYVFGENEFSGMKFLIIKKANAKSEIACVLSEQKAIVTEISVYQSDFQDAANVPRLKALLKGGGIDEFVFTSPDDVFSVLRIAGNENLEHLFSEIKITAGDEITMQTFNENLRI